MRTALCDQLDIQSPVFAFSHSVDVVVAVTNAGGMGVLGAADRTPAELDKDLAAITERVAGRSFGVDFVVPASAGPAADASLEEFKSALPAEHVKFVETLLEQHHIPATEGQHTQRRAELMREFLADGNARLFEVALKYPLRLLATALGPPPPEVVAECRTRNILIAGLVGAPEQALTHREAGADIIVAQGTEAGGHTGEISTMVLVPQVVDAVAPAPVIAAGGIATGRQAAAAIALGAQGVWLGSVWLSTEEAEIHDALRSRIFEARSRDAVRSRSVSGKPQRMLASAWTKAWEQPGAPRTLPMPAQAFLTADAIAKIYNDARVGGQGGSKLVTYPAGQVIGSLHERRRAVDVLEDIVREYHEVVQRQQETAVAADPASASAVGARSA